jgi:hypothetical protein
MEKCQIAERIQLIQERGLYSPAHQGDITFIHEPSPGLPGGGGLPTQASRMSKSTEGPKPSGRVLLKLQKV